MFRNNLYNPVNCHKTVEKVADVREKNEFRLVIRLFTIFGLYELTGVRVRAGIKQIESLDAYFDKQLLAFSQLGKLQHEAIMKGS